MMRVCKPKMQFVGLNWIVERVRVGMLSARQTCVRTLGNHRILGRRSRSCTIMHCSGNAKEGKKKDTCRVLVAQRRPDGRVEGE